MNSFERACFAAALCLALIGSANAEPGTSPRLLRFLEGVDPMAIPMPVAEVADLNDPWAALVLRKNRFPTNLTEALAALDPPVGEAGYSVQHSFLVSESGQLPVDAMLAREFRIVVTRAKPADQLPAILISSPAGERNGFIELMSWDAVKRAFNFYRRPVGDQWTWKGDSRDAFRTKSADKGCFQCHVHGVPIMKELRAPWNNWHSQSASIPPEAIPSVEVREGPLFTKKSPAEELEPVIRGWESQVATALVKQPESYDVALLFRPLFLTDTVNLQTSH
jgi:hypothetical protein